ncbi:MAG: transcriptional repressor [Verrucomicrobiae bacterium]|nr:transcriptional repressor [Verrucomicrobiae bacterium]
MKRILAPINAETKRRRIAEFERRCREAGIPMTDQRRIVVEAVLDMHCHPTADQVYASSQVRRARISRATVYRSLESLVMLGVITKACHPGDVVRYDARLEPHHHLVCLECGEVVDIADPSITMTRLPDMSVFGFEVRDCRMQLRGVCRRCRRKEKKR